MLVTNSQCFEVLFISKEKSNLGIHLFTHRSKVENWSRKDSKFDLWSKLLKKHC
jgi:hypothetical protein